MKKQSPGRPPIYQKGAKQVTYYLPINVIEFIKNHGGSRWIVAQVEKEFKK